MSVTYPGADRPAVDAVSFRVEPGETVGLVGPSGVGKTTCTALLLRFLDPDRGRVTLGGIDVRDLRLDDFRGLVALVAQDTILFAGSLEENLRLAAPEASAGRIADAVAAADLDVLVAALPEGLATPVGERGIRLSGGERQRVAIARALLADAPVLVLDEAAASVDAASEAVIGAALDRLRRGRTTLVVAHRSSTVSAADRVVELPAHLPAVVSA